MGQHSFSLKEKAQFLSTVDFPLCFSYFFYTKGHFTSGISDHQIRNCHISDTSEVSYNFNQFSCVESISSHWIAIVGCTCAPLYHPSSHADIRCQPQVQIITCTSNQISVNGRFSLLGINFLELLTG